MPGRPIWEKMTHYEYKSIVIAPAAADVDLKATVAELFGGANSKCQGMSDSRGVLRLTTTATIQIKYNDTTNPAITITSTESPYIEEDMLINNIFVSSSAGATITVLLKYI